MDGEFNQFRYIVIIIKPGIDWTAQGSHPTIPGIFTDDFHDTISQFNDFHDKSHNF